MSKKAVIFDLDGTLSDSLLSMAYSCNLTLEAFGFQTFETERYQYFVGDGAEELIKRCLRNAGDENCLHFDEVFQKYKEIFEKYCMYEVKPYKGIAETLLKLKEMGMKIAVLSNKPHERCIDVVKTLFGENFFDEVQGQVKEIERKPSPAGALILAQKLNVTPKECIYIGDTDTDMKTGKGAGMFTLGALWGFRTREELVNNQADQVIENPCEILEYL